MKTTGKKPHILNSASTVSADEEINIINRKYDNHPTILVKSVETNLFLQV